MGKGATEKELEEVYFKIHSQNKCNHVENVNITNLLLNKFNQ
jgi:hypothetical protein